MLGVRNALPKLSWEPVNEKNGVMSCLVIHAQQQNVMRDLYHVKADIGAS